MTDRLTLRAFLYYRTPSSPPILCEICANPYRGDLVWETGEPYAKPISQYSAGEFVPLIALPLEVRSAVEEVLDVASEAGPYAGEYFDKKWDLSNRSQAAYDVLRPWLDKWLQPSAAVAATESEASK